MIKPFPPYLLHFAAAIVAALSLWGCASGVGTAPPVAAEGPHQVQLSLSGLRCCDSSVLVAVYRDPADWLKTDRVFKARMVIADGESATLRFYGLPAGSYAVAAFQDSNHNGRLDRWLGFLPREPVAFSQVSQWRRPPKFSAAAFSVPTKASIEVAFR